MDKYRKKPVVIEAVRYTGASPGGNGFDIVQWGKPTIASAIFPDELQIRTLEGVMTAAPGDWIIKGVAGEFYPCKPDIFAATYEAA